MAGGKKIEGIFRSLVSDKNRIFSLVTGVLRGASLFSQSGINSSRARLSRTAPDKICAPTSDPFSTTQTLISQSCFMLSFFNCMAADKPAGPAPTITISISIFSRSTGNSSLIFLHPELINSFTYTYDRITLISIFLPFNKS